MVQQRVVCTLSDHHLRAVSWIWFQPRKIIVSPVIPYIAAWDRLRLFLFISDDYLWHEKCFN